MTALVTVALLAACGSSADDPAPDRESVPTDAVVLAARAFIDALDDEQKSAIMFAYDDPVRENWSTADVEQLEIERTGVRAGDLGVPQRELMHEFLRTALSETGYGYLRDVVGADEILSGSPAGPESSFSPENYWVAFYGDPSASEPWGWQFDGHHLAYNLGVEGGGWSLSPMFLGIEPSTFIVPSGNQVTPMGPHVDRAIELIEALPAGQLAEAELAGAPATLLAGPGQDGVVPTLEGSAVADWSVGSRSRLLDLVALWVAALPDESAAARLSGIEAELDDTYFAYSWTPEIPNGVYYRIQGPTVIVELISLPAQSDEHPGHYHSVYRNPTNEYGLGVSALGG